MHPPQPSPQPDPNLLKSPALTPTPRVILIGGTSHCGKSTLAQSLASRLGYACISTDTLARHPGRPWGIVGERPHVIEHYRTLSPEELLADVLRHYASMWPGIHQRIAASEPLILEGSALWPESVATLQLPDVAALWLTASNRLFELRIHHSSNFDQAAPQARTLIEKFLARTRLYNERMMQAINRLRLPCLDVERAPSLEVLTDQALDRFGIVT